MINVPRGTKDVLPNESYKWHKIENEVRDLARLAGFSEIRTPSFEHTELFLRGVGETSDIVSKEMYTFKDKGDRSITLKPEGTAGVARSFVENGLSSLPQPLKMYYITPVFRYEAPQAGRLREHHQFGVEVFGSDSPYADVEVIKLAFDIFNRFNVKDLILKINNIGCPECRKKYNEILVKYFAEKVEDLCETCVSRLDKNPLRILDCKVEKCGQIKKSAPICLDYLCDKCKKHHSTVISILNEIGIKFEVDAHLVRGLDYYTGTVFEFISNVIGSQGTVCGGGRYNNLIREVGGTNTPAIGFGMGIERLLLLLEADGYDFINEEKPLIYIAPFDVSCYSYSLLLTQKLRAKSIPCEIDILERSFKAQLKYANKKKYKYFLGVGTNEINNGAFTLKNFETGEELTVNEEELLSLLSKEKRVQKQHVH